LFIDSLEKVEDLYTFVVYDRGRRVRYDASELSRSFASADPVVAGRLEAAIQDLR
jgi:hypothetical protein